MVTSLRLPPVSGGRSKVIPVLVALLVLMLGFGGYVLYGMFASPAGVSGIVDGRMHVLASPVQGGVQCLLVQEGSELVPGQLVMALDEAPLQLAVEEARAALELAMQGGVPVDGDSAAEMESLSTLSAQVRAEEERAQKFLEHWSAEHSRAMLLLRSGAGVSPEQRTQAVQDEAATRAHMAQYRAQLESASTRRAEADSRLQRLRQAVQSSRPGAAQVQLWQSRLALAEAALAASTVYAPEGGLVTALYVGEGQQVQQGQSLFQFLSTREGKALWVDVVFEPEQGETLSQGQACRVTMDDGTVLEGTLTTLRQEGERYAARVSLNEDALERGLRPGQTARVSPR